MKEWLPATLFSLLNFGLWGFFSKLAINRVDSKSALIYQTLGVLIIGVITLKLVNFKPNLDLKGISFGLLTGLTYGLGCFFFFVAADKGKVITIVTLTALYPLITIILSFALLQETINLKQCIGIIFALIAMSLLV